MPVERAGVVRGGTLGAAIAEVLAFNGIEVALKKVDIPLVDQALARAPVVAQPQAQSYLEGPDSVRAPMCPVAGSPFEFLRLSARPVRSATREPAISSPIPDQASPNAI